VFDFLLSFLRQGEARQLTVVLKMVNEIRLLGLLGFEPRFSTCGRCGRELGVSEDVCFSPELGGACHHGCADSTTGAGYHLSAATMAVLRRGLALDWDAAARLRLGEKGVTEARTALSAFVRHIRGEEIKSLEFIEKLTVWACSQRERAGG
jgi:recombinational DNA repair protein (RecF pathway)